MCKLDAKLNENELMSRFEYMRIKKGVNKTDCSEALDISRGTLYRRLEKPSKLTLRELLYLRDLFEVETIDDIFKLEDGNNELQKKTERVEA